MEPPKALTLLAGWVPDVAGFVSPMVNVNLASNIDSSIYLNPTRPFVLLGYAETLLMKAEAKQLGLGGAQTARESADCRAARASAISAD